MLGAAVALLALASGCLIVIDVRSTFIIRLVPLVTTASFVYEYFPAVAFYMPGVDSTNIKLRLSVALSIGWIASTYFLSAMSTLIGTTVASLVPGKAKRMAMGVGTALGALADWKYPDASRAKIAVSDTTFSQPAILALLEPSSIHSSFLTGACSTITARLRSAVHCWSRRVLSRHGRPDGAAMSRAAACDATVLLPPK